MILIVKELIVLEWLLSGQLVDTSIKEKVYLLTLSIYVYADVNKVYACWIESNTKLNAWAEYLYDIKSITCAWNYGVDIDLKGVLQCLVYVHDDFLLRVLTIIIFT